jgi:hypothetical protein
VVPISQSTVPGSSPVAPVSQPSVHASSPVVSISQSTVPGSSPLAPISQPSVHGSSPVAPISQPSVSVPASTPVAPGSSPVSPVSSDTTLTTRPGHVPSSPVSPGQPKVPASEQPNVPASEQSNVPATPASAPSSVIGTIHSPTATAPSPKSSKSHMLVKTPTQVSQANHTPPTAPSNPDMVTPVAAAPVVNANTVAAGLAAVAVVMLAL